MQAVARLFQAPICKIIGKVHREKVAGSLAFSLLAAFFTRDLHWPKAWCRLCEHQYDWLFRRQWARHVAETWIFLPLHIPLNAHYWCLELANERSVCKMFAFTVVSRKKDILTYIIDCWRLQFFVYNACLLPKQWNGHFLFICFSFAFCPTKVKFIKVMFKPWWIAFTPPRKTNRIGLLFKHKNGWGWGRGTSIYGLYRYIPLWRV